MPHDGFMRDIMHNVVKTITQALNEKKSPDYAEVKSYNKLVIFDDALIFEVVVRPMKEEELKQLFKEHVK